MQNFSRRTALRLGLLASLSLATPLPSFAIDMPLAIQGYDPVAYFTDGKPVRGTADFEYQWDEHTYRFTSAQHRELFKADPVHYAPQFGNYCAMALALGKIVKADPENWLISDDKLYVFGSPAPKGPELFQKDLAGNITRANQNRSILPKDSN
jgi:YHS domain-containing protein